MLALAPGGVIRLAGPTRGRAEHLAGLGDQWPRGARTDPHELPFRNEELTGFLEHVTTQRPSHSRQAGRRASPGITPDAAASAASPGYVMVVR
jgi:hypothetical protein